MIYISSPMQNAQTPLQPRLTALAASVAPTALAPPAGASAATALAASAPATMG